MIGRLWLLPRAFNVTSVIGAMTVSPASPVTSVIGATIANPATSVNNAPRDHIPSVTSVNRVLREHTLSTTSRKLIREPSSVRSLCNF
jgi:hypothetical protein